jgi:hypothetical protein
MLKTPFQVTSVSEDFIEFDEIEEEDELPPASEWIKEYARYAAPRPVPLTLEQVHEAIKDDFPELAKSDLDLDRLLEEVGIHFVGNYRKFIIAWYGVIGEDNAETLLDKYQQSPYSNVRKRLGIDYLWVLDLNPDLGHSNNAAFEAIVEFDEIEDKPECCVIDL